MKTLKIALSLLALAIAFGAPVAKAQDAKKQTEAQKMKASLSLTDDQYNKIDAIFKDAAKQRKALPSDAAEKKAKSAEITKDTAAKVRAVLTDEQKAKYDELKKKNAPAKGKKDGDKTKPEPKGKAKGQKKPAGSDE